jgi:hypothetical protein
MKNQIKQLRQLNENMAAVFGHWTPDSLGANIRCSPAGHAPHAYFYAALLQPGVGLPHNQFVKSVRGAT